MLTLATPNGSLQVGGKTWTFDSDYYAFCDGVAAHYWQGGRLSECDQGLYLLGTDERWYLWRDGNWTHVGSLPVEKVVASHPSVLAWNDGWWTIGEHGEVLRHGQHIGSGYGVEIHAADSGLDVRSDDGGWWHLDGDTWVATDGPGGAAPPPVTSELPTVAARAASAFIDSIGVTTHLNYLDTAYYQLWPQVRDLLVASGIRHVREGIPRMDAWYYQRIDEWHRAGIKFLGMLGNASTDELAALTASMPYLDVIEGLNEWDLNGGEDWAGYLRDYQARLYQAAGPWGLTVLGPSLTSQSAFEAVGDIGQWMDIAQLHNYYATRNSETPGWGDDGYGSLDWSRRQSEKVGPGKAIWTVETGYATDPGCDPRMPDLDMPEAACVRYLTRLLCFQFADGIGRTYLYQLVDDFTSTGTIDAYATFGLIRSDGTPKATYHAVKNLIAHLADNRSVEASLQYALNEAPDLHQLLLSRSDGTFALLLWLGVESMDPDTRQLREVASQQVTLQVASTHHVRGSFTIEDSGELTAGPAAASFVISDHLTIVEIAPA